MSTSAEPVARTLLVLAKVPRPGRVKTRLTPPYLPRQAAALAAAALADTLQAVAAAPARRRILVLDGPPAWATLWRRAGLEVVGQRGRGLDERLAHAFSLADGPTLLVGMDTPQVTPTLLGPQRCGAEAWFGPAADGGFWALGFAAAPDPRWLLGVPMSRHDTGRLLLARLAAAGLDVADLPELTDVDTAADVHTVAALAPRTRFARLAASLGPAPSEAPPLRRVAV